MSVESLSISKSIGYTNLGLSSFKMEDLVRTLKTMPLLETVGRLSSVNLVLSNGMRSNDVDQRLREVHLNPSLRQQVSSFESKEGYGIVFYRQSCLLLIHLARKYCTEKSDLKASAIDVNIGLLSLVANDFLGFIDENTFVKGANLENQKKAAAHLTRQYLFNHVPQERYSMARSWLLFEGLKGKVPEKNRQDVSQLIDAKRNFTFEQYFAVLLFMYTNWGNQSIQSWDASRVVINPTTFFKDIKISPEKYLAILDSLSVDIKIDRELPNFEDREAWRREVYEHFELRLKPLLKAGGVYICADFDFIKCAFWDGPYHLILTDYPQTKEAKAVLNYLGDATEIYIQHLAYDAFEAKFISEDCGNGNPLGDGVIKLTDDWIVVIESKAARPGIGMVSGNKPITELSDFKKMVKDGLTQMSERIEEFRELKNFKGRISPLLITAGFTPQHKLIWDVILSEISTLSIFGDASSDFPFLIDLESWDVMCATQKSGLDLSEILNLRMKDEESKTSNPHYFFYKTVFEKNGMKEPRHEVLISLFEDRVKLLIKEFFDGDFEKRTTVAGLWKKVFGI